MARITVTFSISLPPEMAEELEVVRRKEHRTRSELLREALRRYLSPATNEWGGPAPSQATPQRLL
jgi:metal-responsive CopG/Arc/MetJ family transcriptional regulator